MSTENITDQATTVAALNKVREGLLHAIDHKTKTAEHLRGLIVQIRPAGVLTVDEMAESVGRDRNYIDSIWSSYGESVTGKQTRVTVVASDDEREAAALSLTDAARDARLAAGEVVRLRAERIRLVTMAYGSKILGPSAIAAESGMDRNHVLRAARKAGLTPAWRAEGTSRNQYTKTDK